MEYNQDGTNFGGDFHRQSGSKHIVSFQGPFYQQGSSPCGIYQQKPSTDAPLGSISASDHGDVQVNTVSVKAVPRSNIAAIDGPIGGFESFTYNRLEHPVAVQHIHNRATKLLTDEVEEEDEEDDCDVDLAINVCSSEQTGRWTRKEHEVFLEALKKFGKVSRSA